ncbi:MAG: hypothetical protein Q8M16_24405 [Pirellulaceae bacterium]|nr:hypothetical protein [Pirellulaceae bacterium]
MPAGDAQRAWFPEMLSELIRFWDNDPDWSAVIKFCETMTSLRSSIWEQRGIKGPLMTCRNCGKKHAMTLPPISPRSLLFALQKIDIITDDQLKQLDKEWMRFRKSENLDALGRLNTNRGQEESRGSTCT